MAGVNKAIILGRLGKDPEVRTTQSGAKIVSFSVATSESWKDKASGERKERTDWHNIVIFHEGLAGVAEKYLSKGDEVYIEGQIRTREYEDRDGNKRWTTEIVVPAFGGAINLIGGAKREAPTEERYGRTSTKSEPHRGDQPARQNAAEIIDDDIPF